MRVECFIAACAIEAATHERTLTEVAEAFAKKRGDGG